MWTYSLDYTRPDGTVGGMTGSGDDFDKAIAQCDHDTAYYVDMGYIVALVYFRELCPECKGEGDRQAKNTRNRFKRVKCKNCKGKGHLVQLV